MRHSDPPTAALQPRVCGTQQIASANVHLYCVWIGTHECLTPGIVRPSESPSFPLAHVGPTHRSIEHAIGRVGRCDRRALRQRGGNRLSSATRLSSRVKRRPAKLGRSGWGESRPSPTVRAFLAATNYEFQASPWQCLGSAIPVPISSIDARLARFCNAWTSFSEHFVPAILALVGAAGVVEATWLQPSSRSTQPLDFLSSLLPSRHDAF